MRAARFTMNFIVASLARRYTLINMIPRNRLPRAPMNSPRPRIVYMECPIDCHMNQQHNHVIFNLRIRSGGGGGGGLWACYSAVAVPENLPPLTTMDFYSLMYVMVLYG